MNGECFESQGPPETIIVIRHAERPTEADTAPFGIDIQGRCNNGSLTPRGWQRAGALAQLFRRGAGPVSTPDHLYAPKYRSASATVNHRTYETILPLSLLFDRKIHCHFTEDEEQGLANAILASDSRTILVCWDHHRIPTIASFLPVSNRDVVPAVWPDDRYDMIWLFTLDPDSHAYVFAQMPQRLLAGDAES